MAIGGHVTTVCATDAERRVSCWVDPRQPWRVEALDGATALHIGGYPTFPICGLVDGTLHCTVEGEEPVAIRGERPWVGYDGRLLRDVSGAIFVRVGARRLEPIRTDEPVVDTTSDADSSCWVVRSGRAYCDGHLVPGVTDAVEIAGSLCVRHRDGGVSCSDRASSPAGPTSVLRDPMRRIDGVAGALALGIGGGFTQCALVDDGLTCWRGDWTGLVHDDDAGKATHHAVDGIEAMAIHEDLLCTANSTGVRCIGAEVRLTPMATQFPRAAEISIDRYRTCVRTPSGEVSCAGSGLRERDPHGSATPRRVGTGLSSIGRAFSLPLCGLRGRTVVCMKRGSWTPLEGPEVDGPLQSAGRHLCGVNGDALTCWRNDRRGEPPSVRRIEAEEVMSPDWFLTCTLDAAGAVHCKSDIEEGAGDLGGWPVNGPRGPEPSAGPVARWLRGSDGVLTRDGRVLAARFVSTTPSLQEPLAGHGPFVDGSVGFIGGVSRLDTRMFGVCGVKEDGTLLCAPAVDEDQPPPEPRKVAEGIRRIDCGAEHACAIRRSGEVVCWGSNTLGRLGTGVGPGAWFDLER